MPAVQRWFATVLAATAQPDVANSLAAALRSAASVKVSLERPVSVEGIQLRVAFDRTAVCEAQHGWVSVAFVQLPQLADMLLCLTILHRRLSLATSCAKPARQVVHKSYGLAGKLPHAKGPPYVHTAQRGLHTQ